MKYTRFLLLGFFTVMLSASLPTQASAEGSGPIFLNKIKNVFSRESREAKVAPLARQNRDTARSSNRSSNSRSSQNGPTKAQQARAAFLARQKQVGSVIQRNNEEYRQKLAQSYQQVQLQAQQAGQGLNSSVAPVGQAAPAKAPVQSTGTTRIIIPQKEDNSGTKPIFKNYR